MWILITKKCTSGIFWGYYYCYFKYHDIIVYRDILLHDNRMYQKISIAQPYLHANLLLMLYSLVSVLNLIGCSCYWQEIKKAVCMYVCTYVTPNSVYTHCTSCTNIIVRVFVEWVCRAKCSNWIGHLQTLIIFICGWMSLNIESPLHGDDTNVNFYQ